MGILIRPIIGKVEKYMKDGHDKSSLQKGKQKSSVVYIYTHVCTHRQYIHTHTHANLVAESEGHSLHHQRRAVIAREWELIRSAIVE